MKILKVSNSISRFFLEMFSWGIGWTIISFLLVIDQPHAVSGVLALGASYGFCAGLIFASLSYFYRIKKGKINWVVALFLGIVATISTMPVLELLGAKFPEFLKILVIIGGLSGMAVNVLALRIENHFQALNINK